MREFALRPMGDFLLVLDQREAVLLHRLSVTIKPMISKTTGTLH